MREYLVKYYVERNGIISEEYEEIPVEASSAEEAIDLVKDYLQAQVIQNSDYDAEIEGDKVIAIDKEDETIIETYINFSTLPAIQEARIEAGITSRAEMSRLFEIPIRTLENWESGKRMPPHWAEKLIVEKLETMRNS